jgi:hypothetical protein
MIKLDFISFFPTFIYSTIYKEWLNKSNSFYNKDKNFKDKIIKSAKLILENMGYDLSKYYLSLDDLNKNNYITCLYFIKCPTKSPLLIFKNPIINKKFLPIKNPILNTAANEEISYKPIKGSLFFFPSYLEWSIKKNNKLKYIKIGVNVKNEFHKK